MTGRLPCEARSLFPSSQGVLGEAAASGPSPTVYPRGARSIWRRRGSEMTPEDFRPLRLLHALSVNRWS
jgi:hypothetical protein